MPIHPLAGLELDLVRERRDHLTASDTLIVEAPDGGRMVLPIAWTDRGPPWVTPTRAGREVRLCARGLLALARAIDAALHQKLGPRPETCPGSAEAPHLNEGSDESYRGRIADMGRPDADGSARSARSVGEPGPEDASTKRGDR